MKSTRYTILPFLVLCLSNHPLPAGSPGPPTAREIDLPDAATNLIEIVRETKDPDAKWRAIRTLRDLRCVEAAPLLLKCLKDDHHHVRANAARALGDMRVKAASGPLIDLLKQEKDRGVIEQASLALKLLQAHEAVPVLKQCANHESVQTRAWVLQAIGDLGSRTDVPFLAERLNSSTTEQLAAAQGIEKLAKVDFDFPKGQGLVSERPAINRAQDWWEKNKSAFQSE